MTLSTMLAGDPAPPPPVPSPERPPVTGFTAEIAATSDRADLGQRLEALARSSAFRFAGLEPTAGADTVRARFELSAPNASAGDAQIYALLFAMTKTVSWQSLRKEYG